VQPFLDYVQNWCQSADISISNGERVPVCYHSGYFMIKYLAPFSEDQEKVDALIDDFCSNYKQILPERSNLIGRLMSYNDEI